MMNYTGDTTVSAGADHDLARPSHRWFSSALRRGVPPGMSGITAAMEQDLWILMRIAVAMLLGGVLGLEREMGRHAAGLRTHMLISGAAALIVGLGDVIAQHFSQEQYRELLRVDPVRLIEAVVAAVGFVGAGAILRSGRSDQVHGLTTASSLLMAAAIGIAAGLGNYALAVGASLLSLLVLAVLHRFERMMKSSGRSGEGGD